MLISVDLDGTSTHIFARDNASMHQARFPHFTNSLSLALSLK
jgi:hypothetical protein